MQKKNKISQIIGIHQRLAEAVKELDLDKLDHPVGKLTTRAAIEFIQGVAEHRLYHTAQMGMIKSLAKHQGIE
jgi:hypothetical protein